MMKTIHSTLSEMQEAAELCNFDLSSIKFVNSNKRIERANIAAAFDIETTSITSGDEKYAFMYIWMFGIGSVVFYGRTWQEFTSFMEELSSRLELNEDRRLVVYVHNLGFEFQFMYKYFEWDSVFSTDPRKPIYAITGGFEFRCSYLLSGLKLERLAKNLTKHKVEKAVGYLDYNLIRHYKTRLTKNELIYCMYDILVLLAYISEQIEEHHNNINHIPYTNTGRVRNFCRKKTLYENHHTYSNLMSSLTLTAEDYMQLKRAFQGGFTHANAFYSGETIFNVDSYDLASSYPSTMVCDLYPMTAPESIRIDSDEEFQWNLNHRCCIFDITLRKLRATSINENIISESKCWNKKGVITNNGRIVEADEISMTVTEIDYSSMLKFYDWEDATIFNFKVMEKSYLPRSFILAILSLYGDKTSLKNVKGKEVEYMRSKGMINSSYGMTVTDIVRDTITFQSTGWSTEKVDIKKAIRSYNTSKRRFLYYPWGVWVTAYARRNLFSAILECENDYVYSDTDSVKMLNGEKHKAFFDEYNQNMKEKLYKMCDVYSIDRSFVEPKSPDGKVKTLGVWEFDGHYDTFKTLGAKRYMVKTGDKLSITVAGINKAKAVPYLIEKYGDKVFDEFSEGLYIPPEYTGKLTHTYIDDEAAINVTDYLGNTETVLTLSGIHLEPAAYELSISAAYALYLNGYKDAVE